MRVKGIKFHSKALGFIRGQSLVVRQRVGEALRDLQKGLVMGMPKSRPMPSVAPGAAELRVKDAGATIRVFYLTKVADLIVVFHAFEKNTQKTPQHEIELGRKRLKEVLDGKD
jgi:phage-related protein